MREASLRTFLNICVTMGKILVIVLLLCIVNVFLAEKDVSQNNTREPKATTVSGILAEDDASQNNARAAEHTTVKISENGENITKVDNNNNTYTVYKMTAKPDDAAEKIMRACMNEYNLTTELLEAAKLGFVGGGDPPTPRQVHCLTACVYKMTGVMDQDGAIVSLKPEEEQIVGWDKKQRNFCQETVGQKDVCDLVACLLKSSEEPATPQTVDITQKKSRGARSRFNKPLESNEKALKGKGENINISKLMKILDTKILNKCTDLYGIFPGDIFARELDDLQKPLLAPKQISCYMACIDNDKDYTENHCEELKKKTTV